LYAVTTLLFAANTFNIAADLSAMAAATRLLAPGISAIALVIAFALLSLLLQIFTTYARYARYLKYLTLALLSYVVVAFSVRLDWGAVLHHTFVPHLPATKDGLLLVAAILGTTISPYLFFWQTAQEIEEDILRGEGTIRERRHEANPVAIWRMRLDVWSGMFFSNLVMFFIFAACAGTLYAGGATTIATADQAARALAPFGALAYWLFAAGIVGTGLLAVPVLAGSSAYAFAEAFRWRAGLYRPLKEAYAFYGVIIVAMALGIVANLIGVDPIKGLILAAVANGVVAPIVLYFVVRLASDKALMGRYRNGRVSSALGWATVLAMTLAGLAALGTLL
ncbi:MAG: divalent metal cation transporter, partial [Patescibacteria group bacterium]|nr:divalent metal cation transporter [Patescibacteria group bacterium]